MTDFTKDHYKIYIRNDKKTFNDLINVFEGHPVMELVMTKASRIYGGDSIPYYIRVKNGKYSGVNDAEFTGCDTYPMIKIEGKSLISFVPEDLFKLS